MSADSAYRPQPWLSLVIPTLGRTAELHACLASIAACDTEGIEILIVDQNSDDRIDAILHQFAPSLKITHLRQQVANASLARNCGAQAARGIWIGFPDDDCKFLPSTLLALRQRIGKGDAHLIVLRLVDTDGALSCVQGYDREVLIDNANIRRTIAEAALCLRRDLFLSVDGFDPAFGPGGIFPADEGIDLIRRLWLRHPRALTMIYCPEIEIVHPQNLPYVDRTSLNKAYRYAQGRGACFARHWRTASKRRALTVVAKAFLGPIVLRGLRCLLGPINLIGCLHGFLRYNSQTRR